VYGQVKNNGEQRESGPCDTIKKNEGTQYEFDRGPHCEAVITDLGITAITHWHWGFQGCLLLVAMYIWF
jgi:uncharacterized ferredoxin-like protein